MTPARAVFDRISPSIGCRTETDVIATTRPHPCSRMAGTAAAHIATVDSRFCSSAGPYCSMAVDPKPPAGGPPALGTRMSIPPSAAIASSTKVAPPPAVETSAGMPIASPPASVIDRTAASSFSVFAAAQGHA